MSYETILYEKDSGLATITLNRPQSLNAFVPQMNQEVLAALKDGERDPQVRCLMLSLSSICNQKLFEQPSEIVRMGWVLPNNR